MTGAEPIRKGIDLSWVDDEPCERDGVTSCVCRTAIPTDYRYFEGHFRGYPVLAGVVQLHELVLPCLRRVRPDLEVLKALSGLKFSKRLGPGEAVEVLLRWKRSSADVHFEICRDGHRCTQGLLVFTDHGTAP